MKITRVLILILALSLALTACGGSTESAPANEAAASQPEASTSSVSLSEIRACDLIDEATAESYLGSLAPEPTVNKHLDEDYGTRLTQCYYYDAAVAQSVGAQLLEAPGTITPQFLDGMEELFEIEIIEGFGEGAIWVGEIGQFQVVQGDFQLIIQVDLDDQDELAVAKELAPAMLEKLP